MTYEVGKFYKVPCVYGQLGSDELRWWPIMGAVHEDKEIINFPLRHLHIDWRFVGKRLLYGGTVRHSYAFPLQIGRGLNDLGFCEPVLRSRKCLRQHPDPAPFAGAKWMPKLEAAHAGCRLAKGMVCPHRGYDLSNEPIAPDGVVTCPMHGLRWNVETGFLAPRSISCTTEGNGLK